MLKFTITGGAFSVGAIVGGFVSPMRVGNSVGENDGMNVGIAVVGTAVEGIAVVGIALGVSVGTAVEGTSVGNGVRENVGSPVGLKTPCWLSISAEINGHPPTVARSAYSNFVLSLQMLRWLFYVLL